MSTMTILGGQAWDLRYWFQKTDGSEVYSDEQVVSKEDATLVGIEMAHKLLSQAGNDFFS